MVLERLKKALGLGKPVRETNVIKITPEILEKVEPILKKELGFKDAEIVRLKDQVNTLTEELKKSKGKLETPEEKVVKQLLTEKKKIEKKEEAKKFREFYPKPYPDLLLWDRKFVNDGHFIYRFLCGTEKIETETGFGYNLLLKKKPDDKNTECIAVKIGLPLEAIFMDPEFLVSSLRAGHVVIRLDSKGIYHAPKEIPKGAIEQMVGKILSEPTISEDDKVKAISEIIIANPDFHRALMQIRKRYEDKIADMEEEMNGVYGDLEDTHRREEKLKTKVKAAETGARVNDIRADAEATLAEVAFQKLYQTMREHNNLLIAAQDSEINRLTSEKANEQLVDAIKETSKRLGVHLVKNDEEIHQLISDWKYKNISEFVQDLLPSKIMTEKETKPPEAPKEAPKEGEK